MAPKENIAAAELFPAKLDLAGTVAGEGCTGVATGETFFATGSALGFAVWGGSEDAVAGFGEAALEAGFTVFDFLACFAAFGAAVSFCVAILRLFALDGLPAVVLAIPSRSGPLERLCKRDASTSATWFLLRGLPSLSGVGFRSPTSVGTSCPRRCLQGHTNITVQHMLILYCFSSHAWQN